MASPLRFRGVLSDDSKLLTKRASSDDSAHSRICYMWVVQWGQALLAHSLLLQAGKRCLPFPADAFSFLPKEPVPIGPPAGSVTGGHVCRGFGIFALLVGRSRSGPHCEHR